MIYARAGLGGKGGSDKSPGEQRLDFSIGGRPAAGFGGRGGASGSVRSKRHDTNARLQNYIDAYSDVNFLVIGWNILQQLCCKACMWNDFIQPSR